MAYFLILLLLGLSIKCQNGLKPLVNIDGGEIVPKQFKDCGLTKYITKTQKMWNSCMVMSIWIKGIDDIPLALVAGSETESNDERSICEITCRKEDFNFYIVLIKKFVERYYEENWFDTILIDKNECIKMFESIDAIMHRSCSTHDHCNTKACPREKVMPGSEKCEALLAQTNTTETANGNGVTIENDQKTNGNGIIIVHNGNGVIIENNGNGTKITYNVARRIESRVNISNFALVFLIKFIFRF